MFWQTCQEPCYLLERVLCRFVLQLDGRSVAGFTFMQYQDILGVSPERNQICLPMPGLISVCNVLRPRLNCNALLNLTPMRPFASPSGALTLTQKFVETLFDLMRLPRLGLSRIQRFWCFYQACDQYQLIVVFLRKL